MYTLFKLHHTLNKKNVIYMKKKNDCFFFKTSHIL